MPIKKKSNAGRKPLPDGEKLMPITVLVKEKHLKQATSQLLRIAARYR